jgi:hypothetical protein
MLKFAFMGLGTAVAIAAVAAVAELAGLPISGGAIGGAIGGVVGAVLIASARGKSCPHCAAELPPVRTPTSFRQALRGGWTCPSCGCHIDRQGRAIEVM